MRRPVAVPQAQEARQQVLFLPLLRALLRLALPPRADDLHQARVSGGTLHHHSHRRRRLTWYANALSTLISLRSCHSRGRSQGAMGYIKEKKRFSEIY